MAKTVYARFFHVAIMIVLAITTNLMSGCRPHSVNTKARSLAASTGRTVPSSRAFVNSLGMEFTYISPGTFTMGLSDAVDVPPAFKELERQHRAEISSGFLLATKEVTNQQFKEFVAQNKFTPQPSRNLPNGLATHELMQHMFDEGEVMSRGPNQPVVYVSLVDAIAFCEWLSEKEGLRYRLPSEEEWEYACRAGSELEYGCTNDRVMLREYAVFVDNAGESTRLVGSMRPNGWGLYDMNGNVWEWTSSIMSRSDVDKTFYRGQTVHIIRGGSYFNGPQALRCAARWGGFPPEYRSPLVGFRIVLEPERASQISCHGKIADVGTTLLDANRGDLWRDEAPREELQK